MKPAKALQVALQTQRYHDLRRLCDEVGSEQLLAAIFVARFGRVLV